MGYFLMYVDTNRALGVGIKFQHYTLKNNTVNGLDNALDIVFTGIDMLLFRLMGKCAWS